MPCTQKTKANIHLSDKREPNYFPTNSIWRCDHEKKNDVYRRKRINLLLDEFGPRIVPLGIPIRRMVRRICRYFITTACYQISRCGLLLMLPSTLESYKFQSRWDDDNYAKKRYDERVFRLENYRDSVSQPFKVQGGQVDKKRGGLDSFS